MEKEDIYYNQKIDCTVHNCNYNNEEDWTCSLAKIKVCNDKDTNEKEATICDSFEKKC